MAIDPKLSLSSRDGLPDALRVLVETNPRGGWIEDPNFDDLIQFWLDRHLMFRRILGSLSEMAEDQLKGEMDPARVAPKLSKLGGMLFNELHMHHQIEDMHYFPVLRQHDPRLVRGFDILDSDHHEIDPMLETFAQAANAVLQSEVGARDPMAALHGQLSGLERMLNRHLIDEEELVVPVLLKFGHDGIG